MITSLKKDKSPGMDGLGNEFYQEFWEIIKDKFLKALGPGLVHPSVETKPMIG